MKKLKKHTFNSNYHHILGGGYLRKLRYPTILIVVVGACLFMLQQSKKETILKEKIEENTLAIYLEEEQINYIPAKDSGYTLDIEKSSCTNGVEVSFDYNTWSVKTNYSNYNNENNQRVKCSLYFTDKYIEPILNGTDPVLEDPLIPVTIEDDGTVKKADLASEWYDYETRQWANAVILVDETKTYASGDVIPEENIESYFVWIPKYRYQLWDLGNYDSLTTIDTSKVHEIPIIFGDYNTSDSVSGECTTPMESGASGNCEVGDYMTHPAFISIPSTGFWVGKFETGHEGATSTTEAEVNERDASKIVVKPNVYSWRGIQVANAFYTSYDYQRNLDSHMMKNTEWGAVAYLQHSVYGSAASVRINNNLDYITGYQANNEPTCGYTATNEECNRYCKDNTCNQAYPNSVLSSTTNNITGVYDMSGGLWEYVMAVLSDSQGEPVSGRNSLYNSGFNGKLLYPDWDNDTSGITEITNGYDYPESKYYDVYKYGSGETNYTRRILGDATGEIGPFEDIAALTQTSHISSWHDDKATMVSNVNLWIRRGAHVSDGLNAGVFACSSINGELNNANSFRLILTP